MVDQAHIKQQLFKYFAKQYDERPFTEDEYDIGSDGTVDMVASVGSNQGNFPNGRMPVQFGMLNGDFEVSSSALSTLLGSPHTVDGDFDCSHNRISSLEGAPRYVGADFSCNNNRLTSLANCPTVRMNFNAEYNRLTTLEGLSPMGCKLLDVRGNPLLHLKHLPATVSTISLNHTPTLAMLGVLMAKNVEIYQAGEIERFTELEKVIQPFMGQTSSSLKKAMWACGAALVKAGFASNARY